MKFKSAEADRNTSFVSQHAEGRNWRGAVARKLYRLGMTGWVYWIGYGSRSRFRRERYEDLFEVCCKFLDERFPGDSVDGHGTDHVDRKGEEEERECDDEHRSGRKHEQLRAAAEWNDDGIACYHNGADGCCGA